MQRWIEVALSRDHCVVQSQADAVLMWTGLLLHHDESVHRTKIYFTHKYCFYFFGLTINSEANKSLADVTSVSCSLERYRGTDSSQ